MFSWRAGLFSRLCALPEEWGGWHLEGTEQISVERMNVWMCRMIALPKKKNIKGIINDVCFNEKRNNKLLFFLLVTLISFDQMWLSRQCSWVRDCNSRQGEKKAQEEAFLQFIKTWVLHLTFSMEKKQQNYYNCVKTFRESPVLDTWSTACFGHIPIPKCGHFLYQVIELQRK